MTIDGEDFLPDSLDWFHSNLRPNIPSTLFSSQAFFDLKLVQNSRLHHNWFHLRKAWLLILLSCCYIEPFTYLFDGVSLGFPPHETFFDIIDDLTSLLLPIIWVFPHVYLLAPFQPLVFIERLLFELESFLPSHGCQCGWIWPTHIFSSAALASRIWSFWGARVQDFSLALLLVLVFKLVKEGVTRDDWDVREVDLRFGLHTVFLHALSHLIIAWVFKLLFSGAWHSQVVVEHRLSFDIIKYLVLNKYLFL